MKSVPSKHRVALSFLNRIVNKLEQQKLFDDYVGVFHPQEREDIIERFEVVPEGFTRYNCIPHRSVFKTKEQTTTKIRPVFNC